MLLRNPQNIVKKCIVKEIEIIAKIMHSYTGRIFFSSAFNKAKNANLIGRAFQGTDFVDEMSMRQKNNSDVRQVKSLVNQCRDVILNNYSTLALQVTYAQTLHYLKSCDYMCNCGININVKIPCASGSNHVDNMQLFCYPEYSNERNQMEPHTLDYLHILTNIRSHICGNGYDYCPHEHFVELCEEQPDILSKSVVVDHTDAQNVFTAI